MTELAESNILIVDDSSTSLNVLSRILEREGYNIYPASGGDVALDAVSKQLPDLILLDIQMPDMDGYEVCRRLKEDELTQDIPVIFISAMDEITGKMKAF